MAALADQRVAVAEPLGARDVGAEEIEQRLVAVLPHDGAGARVHLDHARVGRGVIAAVRPVVEDQEVAVGQRPRVVLLGEGRAAERPRDRARAAVDDDDGGDVAEAHDEAAVGPLGHRVGVRPLRAVILERDDGRLDVQVLPAPPLPDHLAARRHLQQVVGVDGGAGGLAAGEPALDARVERAGQRAQAEEQDVAVAQLAGVVVMIGVLHLPGDLAVPVHLQRGAPLEARPRLEALEVLHDLAGVEQVAVVQQVAVAAGAVGQAPRVDDGAVHVDQVDGTVAEHRRE